jgi:hypothetical protein
MALEFIHKVGLLHMIGQVININVMTLGGFDLPNGELRDRSTGFGTASATYIRKSHHVFAANDRMLREYGF